MSADHPMTEYIDYSTVSMKEWTKLKDELSVSDNPIVDELLSTVDTDIENKLYFEVLESTEQVLFNELAQDYWTNKSIDLKIALLLCIAVFVKDNCKHFKLANLAIKLSKEVPHEQGIGLPLFALHNDCFSGLLRHVRGMCSVDSRSEFILLIEESDSLIRHRASRATLDDVFQSCLDKMDELSSQPSYQSSGNILTAKMSAQFYKIAYSYHLMTGEYTKCFDEVRLCVQYTSFADTRMEERVHIATAMMLSCLVAENIFAFGGVLEQPMILWLIHTEEKVPENTLLLYQVIKNFDEANMDKCHESLKKIINSDFEYAHVIRKFEQSLELKLKLLIVLDICFKMPRGQHEVSFDDVSKATHLKTSIDIQALLVQAIGKKLITGHIDSIAKTLTVTRTQPQAINMERAMMLNVKYEDLFRKSEDLILFMKEMGGPTLHQM